MKSMSQVGGLPSEMLHRKVPSLFKGVVNKDERQIGGYELQVSSLELVSLAEEYANFPKVSRC